MQPKVSVIVPVYNVEQYLPMCLDSIINQTLKDIEVICVNDGSTDNSLKILETYAQKDKRIRVLSKDNGGLSSARNYGLRKATGNYVGFVDSDDEIDNDFYAQLFYLGDKYDTDIVCGIGYNTKSIDEYPEHAVVSDLRTKINLVRNGAVWSKIFKKDLFNNIKFPEGLYWEDNPVLLQLLIASRKVAYTNKAKYLYRDNPNSITRDPEKERKRICDSLIIMQQIKDIAVRQDKKTYNLIIKRFMKILFKEELYQQNKKYKEAVNGIIENKRLIKWLLNSRYSIFERIFSIKNSESKTYKIITIFSLKFKIRGLKSKK